MKGDDPDLWREEFDALLAILRDTELTEECKWAKPCFTFKGANVAIVQKFKGFLALLFVKGALLKDPGGRLEFQGPNSRSGKRMTFRSVEEVIVAEAAIRALVDEAIRVEQAGLSVAPVSELVLCAELESALNEDDNLREAFEALTPGRQRGYNIHLSDAKASATRVSRIEKARDRILDGKGLHDR